MVLLPLGQLVPAVRENTSPRPFMAYMRQKVQPVTTVIRGQLQNAAEVPGTPLQMETALLVMEAWPMWPQPLNPAEFRGLVNRHVSVVTPECQASIPEQRSLRIAMDTGIFFALPAMAALTRWYLRSMQRIIIRNCNIRDQTDRSNQ